MALQTLVTFMIIDYITGLMVAGIFHSSSKTPNGKIESRACFKGLCRKCMALLFVLIACKLDAIIGTEYIRDAVVIGYCGSELISITENAILMNLPVPEAIKNAIEILTQKKEGD